MSPVTQMSALERGLRKRQLARYINLTSLFGLAVLLGIGAMRVVPGQVVVALFFFTLAIHLVAGAYLSVAKCPRCQQRFSRRTLLSFVSSLEDQMTTQCQNCRVSLTQSGRHAI